MVRWSGDGRSLYLVVPRGPQARIERLEIATGRRVALHELSPVDKAGLLDVSYFLMKPDASAYVYSYRCFLTTLYFVEGLRSARADRRDQPSCSATSGATRVP